MRQTATRVAMATVKMADNNITEICAKIEELRGHGEVWNTWFSWFGLRNLQLFETANILDTRNVSATFSDKLQLLVENKTSRQTSGLKMSTDCVIDAINNAGDCRYLGVLRAVWPCSAVLLEMMCGKDDPPIDSVLLELGQLLKARMSQLQVHLQGKSMEDLPSIYESYCTTLPRCDIKGAYFMCCVFGLVHILEEYLKSDDAVDDCIEIERPEHKCNCTISPLGLAVLLDDVKMAEYLLRRKADPNFSNNGTMYSAIQLAALTRREKMVKVLIKNVALLPNKNLNPITLASLFSSKDILSGLIQNRMGKLQINYIDGHTMCPPLMAVVLRGDMSKLKVLLRQKVDMTLKDAEGYTAIFYAIYGEATHPGTCLKMIKALIAYDPSFVNYRGPHGMTPLLFAALEGATEICKLLIKKGSFTDVSNIRGLNPLHCAVLSTEESCVRLFLSQQHTSVWINDSDVGGATPLHLAAILGLKDVALILLEKEADPNGFARGYSNCLVWAVAGCKTSMSALLIEKGAAVNVHVSERKQLCSATDKKVLPCQPLHVAARIKSAEIIELLLSNGANVNGEDSDGNTALHHASNSGCVDSVAVLLGAGACINALNAYGESSLHLAAAQGHPLVIHRLLLGGALCIFALLDTTAQWPIHVAASCGNLECLKLLLKACQYSIHTKRLHDNATPLRLAVMGQHHSCVEYLVKQNSKVNSIGGEERCTVLDVALKEGYTEIADLLIKSGACTSNGRHHRAACLIQAVWRFHRHKRLGKIAKSWAVDTLAITAQQVVQRKRAATVRCARKRRMEWAAGVIQQHWKKYIANKRRYEAKAASLISRIRREKDMYSSILRDLETQSSNINIPKKASFVSARHLLTPISPPFPDCGNSRKQPVAKPEDINILMALKLNTKKKPHKQTEKAAVKALVNSAKTCDDDIDAMRQTLATLSQIGVPQTVTPKLKFDTVPGTTKLPALPSGKSYLVSPTNSQVNFGTEMNPKANSKVTLQFPPPVAKEIKIRSHSKKHPGSPGKCLKESSVQRSKDAKILNSNDCSRNRGQSNGLRYQMDRVIAGRKVGDKTGPANSVDRDKAALQGYNSLVESVALLQKQQEKLKSDFVESCAILQKQKGLSKGEENVDIELLKNKLDDTMSATIRLRADVDSLKDRTELL